MKNLTTKKVIDLTTLTVQELESLEAKALRQAKKAHTLGIVALKSGHITRDQKEAQYWEFFKVWDLLYRELEARR